MKSQRMSKINILLTSVVICVSVVAITLVYLPKIIGYEAYSIETGSMEPTIHTGSMIYVKPCNEFNDYNVGDVVTFSDNSSAKSFTHRIVGINETEQTFKTRGDANNTDDLEPTNFLYAVGKVKMVVPYLGYVSFFLRNTVVKIIAAVIYIAWTAIEIEIFITERKKRFE